MEKPGAWSPVPCVSVRVRGEKRKQPRGRRGRCALDSGPQRLVRGKGVSRRQLSRGHGSDLAAQVGPWSGASGHCGLVGGTMLAQEGGSGD